MKKSTVQGLLILAIIGLAPLACEKSFRVGPQVPPSLTHLPTLTFTPTRTSALPPTATFTYTNTFTISITPTPTFTDTMTFTATSTFTPTPSLTDSLTPTETSQDTPTDTPTSLDTDTETPTEISTDTETPTPTDTIATGSGPVCTVTPVNPSFVNETELVTLGGPTGTNDACTPEDMGTISNGEARVISGSLLYSGNVAGNYDFANNDVDMYEFTTGTDGYYSISLDCFDDGSGGNDFDIYLVDTTCSTTYGSSVQVGTQLENITSTGPITAGSTFIVIVVGYQGAPQSPYRLTIQGL
jgi:hypothetical protein